MNPADYELVDVDEPAKLTRGDSIIWPPDWSATCVLDVRVLDDGDVRVRTVAGELVVPPAERRHLQERPLVLVLARSVGTPPPIVDLST